MPAIFHLNLLKIRSCLYATQFMFFFIVLIMPSHALTIDTASSHFPRIVSFFIEPAIFICFALNYSAYKDVPKKFFEWQIRILIKKFQDTALFWKKTAPLVSCPTCLGCGIFQLFISHINFSPLSILVHMLCQLSSLLNMSKLAWNINLQCSKIRVTWLVYSIWRLLHSFHALWKYFKFYRYILCKKICAFVYKVTDIFNTYHGFYSLVNKR